MYADIIGGCFPVARNSARGRPVLYLDFDGVLHPDNVFRRKNQGIVLTEPGHTLFENTAILEGILEPYPDVCIVLSTTWARVMGFHYAKNRLSPALQKRVIGATFHSRYTRRDEFQWISRGAQVYLDVQRRSPGGWIALDDDDKDWPPRCRDNLVHCSDDVEGLSNPEVQEALKLKLAALSERYKPFSNAA